MQRTLSIPCFVAVIALAALGVAAGVAPAEAGPPTGKGGGKGGGKGAPVKDTTPPTITSPSGITADATFSFGAFVTFSVSATDDKDPSPTVVASPSSGRYFPVGTTAVTVTATDWRSNTSTKTFNVTVNPFTQTVLPPEGVRTYAASWADALTGDSIFVWNITVAADGTVSGTGHQAILLTEHQANDHTLGPALPSGLASEGVVSGTIAADGSGQFTTTATFWVWIYGDYDANGNPVYTQRTASFSSAATAIWDSSANLYFTTPNPLGGVSISYTDTWHVQ